MHLISAGYFYAPDEPDESVMAMCSTEDNCLLVTGDTTGTIKTWNISDYCSAQSGKVSFLRLLLNMEYFHSQIGLI